MTTSNQNYKAYSFAKHGEVYQILEEIFTKFSIKYYLIGANARDVHLYKSGIAPIRLTADVDFAVMISEVQDYEQIQIELLNRGFTRSSERYRLYYQKTNTILDLLPYGNIEKEHRVSFPDGRMDLSVLGFKEIEKHIELVSIEEEGFTLPTSPLEGLFILKLIAWNDKKSRSKDIEDIAFLLKHGWDFYEEEAYQNHQDLFELDAFETIQVSARILGRRMGPILKENEKLFNNVTLIISQASVPKDRISEPELTFSKILERPLKETQEILKSIFDGIHD